MAGKTLRRKFKKYQKRQFKKSGMGRAIMPLLKRAVNSNVELINKDKRIYKFRRTQLAAYTITNPVGTSDLTGVYNMTLNALPNYTEYTNLFSKYRIDKVKFHFTAVDIAGTGNQNQPFYFWKNDSSGLVPGSINSTYVSQMSNVWKVEFSEDNKCFTKTIYPYWLASAYSGGYAEQVGKRSAFLDTAYSGISHYCMAYFSPNVTGSVGTYMTINVDVEVFMTFKDAK